MSGWTVAAMVGQTSGVPLNIPIGQNDYFSDTSFCQVHILLDKF